MSENTSDQNTPNEEQQAPQNGEAAAAPRSDDAVQPNEAAPSTAAPETRQVQAITPAEAVQQPQAPQPWRAQQSTPPAPYDAPAEGSAPYGAPAEGSAPYGAPAQGAPAAPTYGAHSYATPTPPLNPAASANPTEPLHAPSARAAASTPNPTEPIPGNFAQQHGQTQPYPAQSHTGAQHTPTGHAGPGYPASDAYPHTLAPAVTASPKQRRKVGMGLFAGSVVAAALVGGLVAGGSLLIADQTGNNSPTSTSSQSAPLIVNNTNSVNAVTAAAAKAMPSVVTISATSGSSGGTGSGIILDTEGHILTNTHVVTLDGEAAHATIEVQTSDNKVYPATIVGTDPLSDLAIVKINAPGLVPATLGDSNSLNVGDTVIAIGSPLGLNGTVTDGIVSTLNRTIQVASSAVPSTPNDTSPDQGKGGNGFQFSPPGGGQSPAAAQGTVNLNVIQTDAAINPGNSGGALVNSNGQVIGVNVAIASTGSSSNSKSQSGNIGVGFSIPIDHAKQVAEQIIKTGTATHGQLGVSVSATATSSSDSTFSIGAIIQSVTPGSAAAKAGLQKGDVITKLGDRAITDPASLTAAVREQPGAASVKVDFTRGGKAQSVDVALDTMK
ncbi:trypsin-like peptidase domain-containing protein [Arthrobacter sp. LAPM80]|uniref:trypsin-like peptidase domain-containing protein n=1 Tax=Arthrobacter sp. LAPM80 TaxID=3141788 RepID=UPI00398B8980